MSQAIQLANSKERGLDKLSDAGNGRAFVVLFEEQHFASHAQNLCQALSERSRAILLKSTLIQTNNWEQLTDELAAALSELGLRQASIVGFGAASIVAQNLALRDAKLVRTLTLIDASCRPHPSVYSRAVDWLERSLPMGLPFRHRDKGFYSKPFLQRLRCPTLIVNTSRADPHLQEQSTVLLSALPTAWYFNLEAQNEAQTLRDLLLDFETVPAKRPQKNKQ